MITSTITTTAAAANNNNNNNHNNHLDNNHIIDCFCHTIAYQISIAYLILLCINIQYAMYQLYKTFFSYDREHEMQYLTSKIYYYTLY